MHCTQKLECHEKSVHNILIFFLSTNKNEEHLYNYLGQQEEFFKAVRLYIFSI